MMSMHVRPESDPQADVKTKVLAWLAFAALGIAAFLNTVIACVLIFSGHLIGAVGEAAENHDADLASDANHAALVAKLVGIAFALMAATEYAAGHFIKRLVRTRFVPVAMAITFVGELAFDVWTRRFNALDVVILGCAAFATWVWWRLPRRAAV